MYWQSTACCHSGGEGSYCLQVFLGKKKKLKEGWRHDGERDLYHRLLISGKVAQEPESVVWSTKTDGRTGAPTPL